MEKPRVSWIFRFALIFGLLALLMVFMTTPGSAEFYISIATVGINVILAVVSGISLIKKGKKE